jgi:DNA repair exonuclease SbcCD nuclease subunit
MRKNNKDLRIQHVSDIHIYNRRYHTEFIQVCNKLYTKIAKSQPDYILVSGDIFHVKGTMSPEAVQIAGDFFRSLADLAPTIITVGNHDCLQSNTGRLDSISPIVSALNHPSLTYAKYSQVIDLNDDYDLTVLGILDEEEWDNVKPRDNNKTHLVTFHGSVSGVSTDTGWVLDHGDIDLEILQRYDYGLLGDIHEQQSVDDEGKFAYAGSLCQNNHGEKDNKGFLTWDFGPNGKWGYKHHHIPNPKPFRTIELTAKGNLPRSLNIPPKARLRIVANHLISLDKIRKSLDVARSMFNPESLAFVNKAGTKKGNVNLNGVTSSENLRDPEVQQRLITDYLKDYEPDKETLHRVFDLNSHLNMGIDAEADIMRNVRWNVLSIEWDNTFNYGPGNKLDYSKLNGITGLFGPNRSGKSSVLDTLLYCIYNTTSKNNRKNYNIINQTKTYCSATAKIEVNGKIYTISRKSEKYEKKLKGQATEEAKTYVEFCVTDPSTGVETNLNSADRNSTDKEIRKIFGSIEDFLLTSMSSQMDGLRFINEGSTERKKILARFLDLDTFEKKFRLAKDESVDIRALLRKYEENTFDEDSLILTQELKANETERLNQRSKCDEIKVDVAALQLSGQEIQNKLDSAPVEVINLSEETSALKHAIDSQSSKNLLMDNTKRDIASLSQDLSRQRKEISEIDEDRLTALSEELAGYHTQHTALKTGIEKAEHELRILSKSTKVLNDVPCGDNFPTCPLLRNAHEAKNKTNKIENALIIHRDSLQNLVENIENLGPDQLEKEINRLDILRVEIRDTESASSSKELELAKLTTELSGIATTIQSCNDKITLYEDNKEAIECREALLQELTQLEASVQAQNDELARCDHKILELVRSHGSLEQRFSQIDEKKRELINLRTKYAAYDLIMRVLHPNGVSYMIIKQLLPIINDEINKVLANVVDFQILMSADDKKLDVQIKHPKYEPRAIEMASGAEKSLAALAIRIALTNVSTLPTTNMIILDEPATALDDEGMSGFTSVLDLCKSYYDKVILITHLGALKDTADQTIEIERVNGYAKVSQ